MKTADDVFRRLRKLNEMNRRLKQFTLKEQGADPEPSAAPADASAPRNEPDPPTPGAACPGPNKDIPSD
jgi:hypothetical protein